MTREGAGRGSGWPRALSLFLGAVFLSILNPAVLVGVPLALFSLALAGRRAMALLLGGGLGVLVFAGDPHSGLWYMERGWALLLGGWFLALTLRWPQLTFFPRGLGALAGSFAAMALLFWIRPGEWAVVDWAVTSRMEEGLALVIQSLRQNLGPGVVSASTEAKWLEAMALNGGVFPAFLGLASLGALGTAWWAHLRLNRAEEVGIRPLREFRFNDQLVWILILGLVLLAGFSGLVGRMGVNAVVFMGFLYALRGIAVMLALFGGPTVPMGILLFVAFLLVAPFLLAGAFVVGLGDTWFNLRAKRREEAPR